MDWRVWIRDVLLGEAPIGDVAEGAIHSSGTLTGSPAQRPFIEITRDPVVPFGPGNQVYLTIWVHDAPGTYTGIDRAINKLKEVLDGRRAPESGIIVEWTGDSQDLADDGYNTITRNSSFKITTRREP